MFSDKECQIYLNLPTMGGLDSEPTHIKTEVCTCHLIQ